MGHTRDHFRVTGQRWARGLALLVCLLWTVSAAAMDQAPASPRRFIDRFRALNRPAVGNPPNSMNRSHRVGNVWMTITNYGIFGANFMDQWDELVEPDGTPAPSFEFPAGTRANYLYAGSIWFGAVVDIDTLWRDSQGGEQRWKGRVCKVYAKVGGAWKMTMHTGVLEYPEQKGA